jgi:DNA helicase HerA-like ATPase
VDEAFRKEIIDGYTLTTPGVVLGSAVKGSDLYADTRVQVSLAMINRHGLIAGATGTGKTKTLQLLAGELSDAGVPVFVADIKGDLTGLGVAGDAANRNVIDRTTAMGWAFVPQAHPVEFLSLSGKLGAQVRASVHSFGPLLLGKVLDLNPTQTSLLSLVFKYCDDKALPLLDLTDLATTLRYLSSDDGKPILDEYGGMSKASVGVLLRSLVVLEQEGADVFFGEPGFDVADLMRTTPDGKGVISVLELSDVMAKPRLFSTFMLWLLAQLYQALPEAGDLPEPKLAFFFDEAHLLFRDASSALMEQVELTVRLIRSKGVGVYFVTQAPADVPSSVLAQLGNRVQHALRAFTPEDADALRKTARTFPMTTDYDVEATIQSLGIGEALVAVLSPRGVPTPLAATRLLPPDSLMGAMAADAFAARVAGGQLGAKYGTAIDRESAHEIITQQLASAHAAAAAAAGVDPSVAASMTAAELKAAQKAKATEDARAQREALAAQQRAERDAQAAAERASRDAAKAAERQRAAEQKAYEQAQREMLQQQQRDAREAQAAQARAQKQLMRELGGGSRRRRRSSSSGDPTEHVIRSVLGTLFGK